MHLAGNSRASGPAKAAVATTLGVVIGNRDFFPDQLVAEAREDVLKLFSAAGVRPLLVSADETKLGGIETHSDARKCAELFRRHRDEIAGVLCGADQVAGVHVGRRVGRRGRTFDGGPTRLGHANAGFSYELDSIAAVVIGGTSLSGGLGSLLARCSAA